MTGVRLVGSGEGKGDEEDVENGGTLRRSYAPCLRSLSISLLLFSRFTPLPSPPPSLPSPPGPRSPSLVPLFAARAQDGLLQAVLSSDALSRSCSPYVLWVISRYTFTSLL